jgi:hypothetical protein
MTLFPSVNVQRCPAEQKPFPTVTLNNLPGTMVSNAFQKPERGRIAILRLCMLFRRSSVSRGCAAEYYCALYMRPVWNSVSFDYKMSGLGGINTIRISCIPMVKLTV